MTPDRGQAAARLRSHVSREADRTAQADDLLAAHADERAVADDRHAADRDAAALGRDGAHPGEPPQRVDAGARRGAEERASPAQRDVVARLRTSEADQHDEEARLGDLQALAGDRYSDALDRAAEQQEATGAPPDADMVARRETATRLREGAAAGRARASVDRARAARDRDLAADDRSVAADDRAEAADDRARAATDRARAAEDRTRAADDRARAAEDRRLAAEDIQRAFVDDLTGASTRAYGLAAVQHELHRAHRLEEPLVLAFVDVDGLKDVNDRDGHAAGDAVLRTVGAVLRDHLRPYDPVIRVGGDEFVCVLSNTTLKAAATHFEEISTALGRDAGTCSISSGVVALRPGELLNELMARADAELYRSKRARPTDGRGGSTAP